MSWKQRNPRPANQAERGPSLNLKFSAAIRTATSDGMEVGPLFGRRPRTTFPAHIHQI